MLLERNICFEVYLISKVEREEIFAQLVKFTVSLKQIKCYHTLVYCCGSQSFFRHLTNKTISRAIHKKLFLPFSFNIYFKSLSLIGRLIPLMIFSLYESNLCSKYISPHTRYTNFLNIICNTPLSHN